VGWTDPGRVGSGSLTGAGRGRPASALPRLMLVTDRLETRGRDLVDVVEAAVMGGVRLVQVRERDLPEAEVEVMLRRILDRLGEAPVRLLVNGHPALAGRLGIGLHLPASAPAPGPAGPPFFGRAVHDEGEAWRALAEAASYAVVGPVFPTGSKPGHAGAGLEVLARLASMVFPMPVFAIGGLTPERVAPVLATGVHGVAVRSAILGAPDPARAARAFVQALSLS
jgi:thiamine-phosphate diphosphorylase